MQVYSHEVPVKEGFDILSQPIKHDRLVRGKRIDRPSGWLMFKALEGQEIKCWCCGVVADRWVVTKGPNDFVGYPTMNLYADGPRGIVLMTRDHIIPKSLGGIDDVANLRPGCSLCNEERSNEVTLADVQWAKEHPELIDDARITKGLETLQRHLARLKPDQKSELKRLRLPYEMMGYL